MFIRKGSIPILLYIKEVDSLRLIHPTSHHTFAYKGGLRPEAEFTYSWVSYLIYKKLGMLPSAKDLIIGINITCQETLFKHLFFLIERSGLSL
ncbi:MAG: hypothetical protein K8F52_02530 [Candidatus Scalindua rubra]|nr:hypothetical protein [Candidatus Scalindua rubra]TWU34730.1 hypothetical protein S225a_10880 [Candidatus Brocadiaceae bacterium S225]